jgi:hypothetical protein
MRRILLLAMTALALGATLAAACGSDGTRKVVVNQRVCGNIPFLRVSVGETSRIVLDNTDHSDDQAGMSLTMQDFPVEIVGEVPEGSSIGPSRATILLSAQPGDESEVEVRPLFTGIYRASCKITVRDEGGLRVVDYPLDFQLTSG